VQQGDDEEILQGLNPQIVTLLVLCPFYEYDILGFDYDARLWKMQIKYISAIINTPICFMKKKQSWNYPLEFMGVQTNH